jgi:hypothetical protein
VSGPAVRLLHPAVDYSFAVGESSRIVFLLNAGTQYQVMDGFDRSATYHLPNATCPSLLIASLQMLTTADRERFLVGRCAKGVVVLHINATAPPGALMTQVWNVTMSIYQFAITTHYFAFHDRQASAIQYRPVQISSTYAPEAAWQTVSLTSGSPSSLKIVDGKASEPPCHACGRVYCELLHCQHVDRVCPS